jgi:hypothetical protein
MKQPKKPILQTPAGIISAAVIVVAACVFAFIEIRDAIRPAVVAQARHRMFVDSATMQPFRHDIEQNEEIPVTAPSGGKTGFPAELCYWTQDGKVKTDPTPVLLNIWIGKSGPTFCPDCGRLVVGNNPYPGPGAKPPPTRDEYIKAHAAPVGGP